MRCTNFRLLGWGFVAFIGLGTCHISFSEAQDRPDVELRASSPVTEESRAGHHVVADLGPDAYRQIQTHSRLLIRGFPLDVSTTVDLELERFTITDATTRIVMGSQNGDVPVQHPDVTLLRGHIIGEDDSLAFLGLSSFGINGFLRMGGREFVFAPQDHGDADATSAAFLVHERSAPHLQGREVPFQCLTTTGADAPELVAGVENVAGAYPWRIAWVAIDCDYEYGQMFDDLNEATVYAIELLGAVSSIYERDLQVRLHIPFLRVWSTSSDPYTADNVQVLLSDLTSYWTLNMGSVERDIVHLLSGEPGQAGLANVNVLCDQSFGYGVSAGLVGAFPRPVPLNDSGPVDTFDLKIVAHEMGHQFGSPHTHCYSPPIDYCGRSFDDCWNGAFQCQQGTIMSYCDRVDCVGLGGGKDLRFHDRVVTRIRQSVDASCLRDGMNTVYIDWTNNTGVENGSILFPFNTVLEGLQVVSPGGTLQIDAGNYFQGIVANRLTILRTTGGAVRIGP